MSLLQVQSVGDYLAKHSGPTPWIIKPFCITGSSIMLFGRPKVGKSRAIMQLCNSVITGEPWMGFPVEKTGKVVYLQLDMATLELRRVIEAGMEAGMSLKDGLYIPELPEKEHRVDFDILRDDDWARLGEICASLDPTLVIVDTINDGFRPRITDKDVNMLAREVHKRFMTAVGDAALVFINHKRKQASLTFANKDAKDEPDEDGYLGGSGWAGVASSTLELFRRKDKSICLWIHDMRLEEKPATFVPLLKKAGGFFEPKLDFAAIMRLWPGCLPADERKLIETTDWSKNMIFKAIAEYAKAEPAAVKTHYYRYRSVEYPWLTLLDPDAKDDD